MYNIILDRLPTDYQGYLIRTSFRIGIQINMCLQDDELDEDEKIWTALNLLYGNGIPEDPKVAMDGLKWFLECGAGKSRGSSPSNKTLLYWDFDSSRIYSSFEQTYHIDLTKEDMHWFKFMAMFGSLNKDSAMSGAMQVRDYDISQLKGKARADYIKLKDSLTPGDELSDEEQKRIDEFNALFDGGDVNG